MKKNKTNSQNARANQTGVRHVSPVLIVILTALLTGILGQWLFVRFLPQKHQSVTDSETADVSAAGAQATATPTAEPVWQQSPLTDNQLMQRITDAISGQQDVEDVFRSIPKQQLDGLTIDEFSQYIYILNEVLPWTPTSFAPMTVSERDRQIAAMISTSSSYAEMAEANDYFWLESSGDESEHKLFAVALQLDSSGSVYLDKDWVTGSVDIYEYLRTYYATLEKGNAETLAAMLPSLSTNTSVKNSKAQALIDFYAEYVDDDFSTFEVQSLRPDSVTVKQPLKQTEGTATTRTMSVTSVKSGSFTIRDRVADTDTTSANNADYSLENSDNESEMLLSLDQTYSLSDLTAALGQPLLLEIWRDADALTTDASATASSEPADSTTAGSDQVTEGTLDSTSLTVLPEDIVSLRFAGVEVLLAPLQDDSAENDSLDKLLQQQPLTWTTEEAERGMVPVFSSLQGQIDWSELNWSGQLIGYSIYSESYSIGDLIQLGETYNNLLLRQLFCDLDQFYFLSPDQQYSVTPVGDSLKLALAGSDGSGIIHAIRVGRVSDLTRLDRFRDRETLDGMDDQDLTAALLEQAKDSSD
ncbi:hypothetical protein HCH52_03110 [Oscillospiraceae bacterium HV4-5-C5C]|nr:hypothetical protein [Oscillospiraceae bacterium HV4-5-C5C]